MASPRRALLRRAAALAALGWAPASAVLAACSPSSSSGGETTPAAGATVPAAAGQAKPGGTLRLAIYQEPGLLNPWLNPQNVTGLVAEQVLEGLLDVDERGNRVPLLAAEVPSVQNGGVSADGKTVTYKLRRDVRWHDGQPFTAKDVLFTYQVIMDPSNPVNTRAGYSQIGSVETPDDYTVVVRFKEFYAPFLALFSAILPAHVFSGTTSIEKHEFGRRPLGTGPFKFVEWASGDHITLARNPDYWVKGRPYLDQVIFRITPSREVAVAQLKTGEADVVWNLIEAQIPDLAGHPDIDVWAEPGTNVERLVLNLSAPSGPHQGDPDYPHPILGDPRVREAIELAINKQQIVDKLLYGKTTVGSSPLPTGWAAPKIAPSEYSPEKARRLLDEAGWKPGPDGIRIKDGVRAQMIYSTTTGDQLRELTQQVIQEQLKNVGIALEIKNLPSAVLLGSWQDNAPRKRGNFDINMWTTGAGIDPQSHLFGYFHSSQIPSEANRGEGFNFSRLRDQTVDKALEEAGATPDQEKRKAAYERAIRRIVELRPHIFLYNRLDVDGARKYVKGHVHNPWRDLGWDLKHWWLAR
jgi:peptide/nickel transport system substrate-binding protein